MSNIRTRTVITGIVFLVLLSIGGGVCYFLGGTNALNKLEISYATPDQIAKAMSDDDFYGNWRESTLVIQGTVADVTQQKGDTIIHFKTNAIFQAYCDIGAATTSAQTGDTIKVIAEGFEAQRLASGVQLMGCKVLQ